MRALRIKIDGQTLVMPFRADPARPRSHGVVWWRGEWRPVNLRDGGRRLVAGGPLGTGGQHAGANLASVGASSAAGATRASVDLNMQDGGMLAGVGVPPGNAEIAELAGSEAFAVSLEPSNFDLGVLADTAANVWQGTVDAVGDAGEWYADEQSKSWESDTKQIREEGLIGYGVSELREGITQTGDTLFGEGATDAAAAAVENGLVGAVAIGTGIMGVGSIPVQTDPPPKDEDKKEEKSSAAPLLIAAAIAAAVLS